VVKRDHWAGRPHRGDVAGRFLTREQVANKLAISKAQVYALLRRKSSAP